MGNVISKCRRPPPLPRVILSTDPIMLKIADAMLEIKSSGLDRSRCLVCNSKHPDKLAGLKWSEKCTYFAFTGALCAEEQCVDVHRAVLLVLVNEIKDFPKVVETVLISVLGTVLPLELVQLISEWCAHPITFLPVNAMTPVNGKLRKAVVVGGPVYTEHHDCCPSAPISCLFWDMHDSGDYNVYALRKKVI